MRWYSVSATLTTGSTRLNAVGLLRYRASDVEPRVGEGTIERYTSITAG